MVARDDVITRRRCRAGSRQRSCAPTRPSIAPWCDASLSSLCAAVSQTCLQLIKRFVVVASVRASSTSCRSAADVASTPELSVVEQLSRRRRSAVGLAAAGRCERCRCGVPRHHRLVRRHSGAFDAVVEGRQQRRDEDLSALGRGADRAALASWRLTAARRSRWRSTTDTPTNFARAWSRCGCAPRRSSCLNVASLCRRRRRACRTSVRRRVGMFVVVNRFRLWAIGLYVAELQKAEDSAPTYFEDGRINVAKQTYVRVMTSSPSLGSRSVGGRRQPQRQDRRALDDSHVAARGQVRRRPGRDVGSRRRRAAVPNATTWCRSTLFRSVVIRPLVARVCVCVPFIQPLSTPVFFCERRTLSGRRRRRRRRRWRSRRCSTTTS